MIEDDRLTASPFPSSGELADILTKCGDIVFGPELQFRIEYPRLCVNFKSEEDKQRWVAGESPVNIVLMPPHSGGPFQYPIRMLEEPDRDVRRRWVEGYSNLNDDAFFMPRPADLKTLSVANTDYANHPVSTGISLYPFECHTIRFDEPTNGFLPHSTGIDHPLPTGFFDTYWRGPEATSVFLNKQQAEDIKGFNRSGPSHSYQIRKRVDNSIIYEGNSRLLAEQFAWRQEGFPSGYSFYEISWAMGEASGGIYRSGEEEIKFLQHYPSQEAIDDARAWAGSL